MVTVLRMLPKVSAAMPTPQSTTHGRLRSRSLRSVLNDVSCFGGGCTRSRVSANVAKYSSTAITEYTSIVICQPYAEVSLPPKWRTIGRAVLTMMNTGMSAITKR